MPSNASGSSTGPAAGSSHSGGGILRRTKQGAGVLLDPARPGREIFVPAKLIQQHGLVEGASVAGPVRQGKRGPQLARAESVCGLAPEAFQKRTPFRRLVAVDPDERFHLEASGETSMRIIDLVAPLGKGTRGLIVSPPKAGKTVMLEQIARAIRVTAPETRLIILLVDERPEEVTFFRRAVEAEVFASSSDQSLQEHITLSELMLAHIRTELECERDVVLLLDSLTRMTRGFNLRTSSRGRSLSGGLEAGALEIPRRFFGVARNIEDGGSVTILATVLVDTGSRLDQVIFEEFKGTGNSEIVLDRSLAEARIFPAINVMASGTRKEERLYSPDEGRRVAKLRRMLADRKPREAMRALLQLLGKYPTNEELLQRIPL
jgi:transcription termination factor Rho